MKRTITLAMMFLAHTADLCFGEGTDEKKNQTKTPAVKPVAKPAAKPVAKPAVLRPIRVAMFDVDVLKGVEVESAALTDQVNVLLSMMDNVTIVNRGQIKKVADEQKLGLSGLVDPSSAVKLGKFLSANYVITGRTSKIGQTYYLVLKVIDVETTVQTTVSAKSPVQSGLDALLGKLDDTLTGKIKKLQRPKTVKPDLALAALKKNARFLMGKTVLVHVAEEHVNRPLKDPAAQMSITHRLQKLGLNIHVITVSDPPAGWMKSLKESGKYGKTNVDYLIEGEGVSAHAAVLYGLTSCRARVELRMVKLPGTTVSATDRGVAAGVDLVESLAAKTALEQAGQNAVDALVARAAKRK
jgi:hypothetical protein